MRRSRFTETQIVAILQEAETGKKTREICRHYGISEATYYHWKAKYGGMSASDLKRLKESEGEVTRYKRMYAELARENDALKALLAKSSEATGEARSRALPGGRMGPEQGPRLWRGTLVALELVPAGLCDELPRSGSEGGAERRGGGTPPLGLLDVLSPPTPVGPGVEPQTRIPHL